MLMPQPQPRAEALKATRKLFTPLVKLTRFLSHANSSDKEQYLQRCIQETLGTEIILDELKILITHNHTLIMQLYIRVLGLTLL